MFYTIYKVTNKINGKHYIGKHQTKNLDDGYMGSGNLIKRAIKKHGIENFTKEILHVFQTEEEMTIKEKELVTITEGSYNLCEGGKGGFGYINKNKLRPSIEVLNTARLNKLNSNSQFKIVMSNAGKLGAMAALIKMKELNKEERQKYSSFSFQNRKHTEKTKIKISERNKGRVPWNKGIPRTEEDKQKIRNAMKRKRV